MADAHYTTDGGQPDGASFSVGCTTHAERRAAEDIIAKYGFGKTDRKQVEKYELYRHLWRSFAQLNLKDRDTRVVLTWLFGGNQ